MYVCVYIYIYIYIYIFIEVYRYTHISFFADWKPSDAEARPDYKMPTIHSQIVIMFYSTLNIYTYIYIYIYLSIYLCIYLSL